MTKDLRKIISKRPKLRKRFQKKKVKFLEKVALHKEAPTAQKMKFSIRYFLSKCDQETADLVIFNQEIFDGKLHFCSVACVNLLRKTKKEYSEADVQRCS